MIRELPESPLPGCPCRLEVSGSQKGICKRVPIGASSGGRAVVFAP